MPDWGAVLWELRREAPPEYLAHNLPPDYLRRWAAAAPHLEAPVWATVARRLNFPRHLHRQVMAGDLSVIVRAEGEVIRTFTPRGARLATATLRRALDHVGIDPYELPGVRNLPPADRDQGLLERALNPRYPWGYIGRRYAGEAEMQIRRLLRGVIRHRDAYATPGMVRRHRGALEQARQFAEAHQAITADGEVRALPSPERAAQRRMYQAISDIHALMLDSYSRNPQHRPWMVTLTLPTHHHSHREPPRGRVIVNNPRYEGVTVRAALHALSRIAGRAGRAARHLGEIQFFVGREPHRDGTPHEHWVLFADPAQLTAFIRAAQRAGAGDIHAQPITGPEEGRLDLLDTTLTPEIEQGLHARQRARSAATRRARSSGRPPTLEQTRALIWVDPLEIQARAVPATDPLAAIEGATRYAAKYAAKHAAKYAAGEAPAGLERIRAWSYTHRARRWRTSARHNTARTAARRLEPNPWGLDQAARQDAVKWGRAYARAQADGVSWDNQRRQWRGPVQMRPPCTLAKRDHSSAELSRNYQGQGAEPPAPPRAPPGTGPPGAG